MNLRHYNLHGDPCIYCPERRPGKTPRAALTFGCCALCWLGSNESQRLSAELDSYMTPSPQVVAREARNAEMEGWWGL